ncbi:MAG: PAS domain S-box protein [Bacteroidales bacterium]|nr:PAS domain S-box protein [Bacteroidales bacterium]
MKPLLRILVVEDSEDDALLVLRQIKKGEYDTEYERVQTAETMKAALHKKNWDVVLSDYVMPHFNGLEALGVLKESGIDIPFIIISGTIGEEVAVEAMKAGAHDYIMKNNLKRLLPAIERELRESADRAEKREFEQKQKQTEKLLHESEERFRRLAENARDVIYRMTIPDGKYEYVSPAALSIFGYSPEECYNAPLLIRQAIHPDWNKYFEEQWTNLIKGEMPPIYEYQFIHKSGEVRWLNQRNILVCDNTEKPIAIEGIVTDITERKQAEETLKEQYSKLQGIIESTDALIFALDRQYRYTSFNHGHASMMKLIYNIDIKIGQNMLDYMMVAEDREKAKQNLDRALNGEQIIEEAYFGDESRSRLYFQVSHNPIKTENGNIIGVVVLAQDISERRQMEETLRKNECTLKEAQRVGRLGSWELNIINNHLTWSDQIYRIFEIDPIEFGASYEAFLNAIHPDDREKVDFAYTNSLKTHTPYTIDHRIRFTDGRIKYVQEQCETFYDSEGKPLRSVGVVQDITERKSAEEAIQHSEYVTSIMNQISNAFLTHSDDEIYNQVLDIILKIFNCKIGLFGYIDQNFDLVIPSLTRNIWDKCQVEDKTIKFPHESWGDTLWGKAIREKKTYTSSGTFHIPIGHMPINNFITVPIVYCNETIGLLSLANRDDNFSEEDCDFLENIASYMSPILKARLQRDEQLIKRKIAEEEVLKLSKGIEQSPVSIIITDINGSIEYVNPKFCELTGYTKSEVIGENPRILKSGFSAITDYKVLWDTINSGKVWIGEFYNKKKSGEYYWESASIAPIFNPNNEIIHFISIKEDITEKKYLLNDLVTAKEKAEESNRLKTEFIHNMSHEIRTPMNGIMGYSQLLNEPNLSPEKQKQFTKIISNSSAQLLRIMDDILEISMLDAKQTKTIANKVCLNDLLLELFSIFDLKAKENKIPLYLKKGLPNSKSIIFTDETKLSKILSNILENALKFTLTGFVEIGYQLHDDLIKIYVKDTGIGINPKMQETIFERFSQEDKENTRLYGGLGLGLSIAKENAELIGGKITLKSEKGKGSTFYVTIPYKPAFLDEEINKPNVNTAKISELTEIYTILVAEDEEVNYLYIETLFEINAPNIKVLHATNGQEAVEICKNNLEIDLVLMDIKMPVMNGYEATKQIKIIRPNLPIIAQTAYSTEGDKNISISAGCDDFISKPINGKKIFPLIAKYLTKK